MLAGKSFIIATGIFFVLVGGILLNFSSTGVTNITALPVRSHPRIKSNDGAPAIPAHQDNTLITVPEVENYGLTHPCAVGPTVSGNTPGIIVIQLMTSRNASNVMHGEYVGLPDDALVYYVLLKGPFIPVGIITVTSVRISSVDLIEEVFDAYSGNELVWGTK